MLTTAHLCRINARNSLWRQINETLYNSNSLFVNEIHSERCQTLHWKKMWWWRSSPVLIDGIQAQRKRKIFPSVRGLSQPIQIEHMELIARKYNTSLKSILTNIPFIGSKTSVVKGCLWRSNMGEVINWNQFFNVWARLSSSPNPWYSNSCLSLVS